MSEDSFLAHTLVLLIIVFVLSVLASPFVLLWWGIRRWLQVRSADRDIAIFEASKSGHSVDQTTRQAYKAYRRRMWLHREDPQEYNKYALRGLYTVYYQDFEGWHEKFLKNPQLYSHGVRLAKVPKPDRYYDSYHDHLE